MRTIILDIETKPRQELWDYYSNNIQPKANLKDPVKIEEDIREKRDGLRKKMSVDTDLCEIAVIGVKELHGKSYLWTLDDFACFLGNLEEALRVVTFNGKKFDIPVIIKEGARKDTLLSYDLLLEMTRRNDSSLHVDMMEMLAVGEYGKFRSKDEYAKIYLGIDATPICFETCTLDELKAHCLEDLDITEQLYDMFNHKLY